MKDHEDSFGHAVLDYHRGKEVRIIIERNDGNPDVSDELQSAFENMKSGKSTNAQS